MITPRAKYGVVVVIDEFTLTKGFETEQEAKKWIASLADKFGDSLIEASLYERKIVWR